MERIVDLFWGLLTSPFGIGFIVGLAWAAVW